MSHSKQNKGPLPPEGYREATPEQQAARAKRGVVVSFLRRKGSSPEPKPQDEQKPPSS